MLIEEFITQIKSKGFSMSLKLVLSLEINTRLKEKDDQNKWIIGKGIWHTAFATMRDIQLNQIVQNLIKLVSKCRYDEVIKAALKSISYPINQ